MSRNRVFSVLSSLTLLFFLHLDLAHTSFITKVENGFERIVISIDDRLALPSNYHQNQNFKSNSSGNSATFTKGSQNHECKIILEQLKDLVRRSSEILYKSTNGQTYFRQVSILLPSNWANYNCTGDEIANLPQTATYQSVNSADIQLIPDHPVYIDKPQTEQFGPCGTPGRKISLPVSYLASNPELKARLMVREWIKFRYGVFDENGYSHDDKYPAEFELNGKIEPTACHLNRSCGDNCSSTESSSAKKDISDFYPKAKKSLMSLPLDANPNANEFCNEHTHIRTTPTKHNFLCDGQSIWEVMNKHADFHKQPKNMENPHSSEQPSLSSTTTTSSSTTNTLSKAPLTQFSYVVAKSHRMIFLLDRSKAMNQKNRWINLRRSLYRMFHFLPSGVELGVVSYTNTSTISLPLTVATTHNRDHLHGRIPLRPLSSEPEDSCVSCSLRSALKLIKSSGETIGPTTLVLINSSPNARLNSKEWDKLHKIIDNAPIRLIVISYVHNGSIVDDQLVNLAKSVGGGVGNDGFLFNMPESPGASNLDQSETLNNIFLQIISETVGLPLNKVYKAEHWAESDWTSRGKFTIEDSLGRNTWVTVTTEESGDVDGLMLISPTGKEFELPLHVEGLVYIKIPGVSEAGIWSYIIKYYQNQTPRPVSVDVVTESRKAESISVKFWNQVVSDPNANSEVVLLYAQVLQGDLPVINANITAQVTMPGQQYIGKVSVKLYDTGSGDPDITWGDGIYSAYYTQLGANPGFFSISVEINDNSGHAVVPVHTNISRGLADYPSCCGSSVPHIATIPTGYFSRKISGPSFQIVQGVPFGVDPYPPSRITDLKIEKVIENTSEIKLSWTSPGGDFDKGKAARYEIRCYTSREALTNDNFGAQGILVHSSLTPEPEDFGMRQSCTVGVPWANEIFYYGIVPIDSALNRGKVSNLVSVLIKESPTSTLKIIDAWEDDALVSNLSSSRSLNHKNENVFQAGASWFRGLNEVELYFIIGGAGAFLLLISTFILVLVCVKRNKSKGAEAPPAYHNIYVTSNGKNVPGGPPGKDHKDGNGGVQNSVCCWENESNSTDSTSQQANSGNKISSGGISGPYLTETASSYIPASALCAPYRDMYQGHQVGQNGHHQNDSSSVGSKNSDSNGSGSNETVQVTDGLSTPMSMSQFYNPHTGLPLNMTPQHSSNNNLLMTQQHNQNQNHQLQYHHHMSSDEDDGGFRHKMVPMPNPSDYLDHSPNSTSTYGGSIMSIHNNSSINNSSKKRTRHISFV